MLQLLALFQYGLQALVLLEATVIFAALALLRCDLQAMGATAQGNDYLPRNLLGLFCCGLQTSV